MVSKPIVLMAFPLALYIAVSIIFNNALVWQQLCGRDFTCQAPFQVFSMNGPLTLVLSGRLDIFWNQLTNPSFAISPPSNSSCPVSEVINHLCPPPSGVVTADLIFIATGIFGAGILVFVSLGLHVHFEAATVAVEFGSSGDQPAKLAQSLGIGLLIWTTIYGVFGGWETYLNQAVMGAGGIFDLLILITFAIGVVWFTQSRF